MSCGSDLTEILSSEVVVEEDELEEVEEDLDMSMRLSSHSLRSSPLTTSPSRLESA